MQKIVWRGVEHKVLEWGKEYIVFAHSLYCGQPSAVSIESYTNQKDQPLLAPKSYMFPEGVSK